MLLPSGELLRPGQLTPANIDPIKLRVLKENGSLLEMTVPIDLDEGQDEDQDEDQGEDQEPVPFPATSKEPVEVPVESSKFDYNPTDLAELEDGQLQVMLTSLGQDPEGMSADSMRAQLSSGYAGDENPSPTPETTGDKMDQAIDNSDK